MYKKECINFECLVKNVKKMLIEVKDFHLLEKDKRIYLSQVEEKKA